MPSLHAGELLPRLRCVAIMTAFNEGDVIAAAIGALVADGIDVYLIDNCSTDDTVAQAERWLGRGVVHIERFPDDAGFSQRNRHEYVWRDILTRVEQVAARLDADWLLFVNADEFRESPWPDLDLGQALAFVDSLGYNAVNFELFDFQPVDDDFVPGTDVRDHIRGYERGEAFNTLQVKAWRKPVGAPAQVAATGGHDVGFPGRRLCPVPFILRHYGLRGETHGRRKVFEERLPRFAAEERAGGWHVQYDAYARGERQLLRDPASLVEWDAARVRAELLARSSRALLLAEALRDLDPAATPLDGAAVGRWAERVAGVDAAAVNAAIPHVLEAAAAPATIAAARLLESERQTAGDLLAARRLRERVGELHAARLDARAFVTAASVDELVAHPELLRAYAATFDASDEATLVVHGSDVARRLSALLEEQELLGDGSPDVLALEGPDAALTLSRRAGAVLTLRGDGPLPSFGPDDCERLRARVSRVPGAPSPPRHL